MIGHGGKEPGRVEHPSFGHAVMHMAKMHAEGDHMHILSHNEGFTSHHVLEGASVQGPHESDTVGQLKKHVESALNDEAERRLRRIMNPSSPANPASPCAAPRTPVRCQAHYQRAGFLRLRPPRRGLQ